MPLKRTKNAPKLLHLQNQNNSIVITEPCGVKLRVVLYRLPGTLFEYRIYALSGILKCELCGSPFAGNAGYYRCNAKVMGGRACPNNAIAQDKAEEAIFTLLRDHILKFRSIRPIVEAVKRKLGRGVPRLRPLERRLIQIERDRKRLMTLFRRDLMELDEVEQELATLKDAKKEVRNTILEMQAQEGITNVTDDAIRSVIETLGEQVRNSDSKIRKRAAMTLFQDLKIGPKTGSPWVRNITAKGIYVPLAGINVASPRGFEPLSPA